jgi:hypothetical protein
MPVAQPIYAPRWYLIPVRVLLVTFVVTLLSFAVSVFFGILGILLAAHLRGVTRPNLTLAYRYIAFPAAAMVAVLVVVSATAMEIRHYRQQKTLQKLEHQMSRVEG